MDYISLRSTAELAFQARYNDEKRPVGSSVCSKFCSVRQTEHRLHDNACTEQHERRNQHTEVKRTYKLKKKLPFLQS